MHTSMQNIYNIQHSSANESCNNKLNKSRTNAKQWKQIWIYE